MNTAISNDKVTYLLMVVSVHIFFLVDDLSWDDLSYLTAWAVLVQFDGPNNALSRYVQTDTFWPPNRVLAS